MSQFIDRFLKALQATEAQGSDEGVSSSEDEEHDLSDTAQDLLQQLDPACNPFSGLTAAYYREERPSSVGRKVLVIVRYGCHRGRRSKPSRREGKPDQRQSKKVGCLYQLTATIFADDPGNVYFVETHPHCYHTPGSKEDVRWLKLHEDVKNRIEELYLMEMVPSAIQKTIEREVLAEHGVNGLHRRYLPSLRDIRNIIKNIRNNLIDDSEAVAKPVESVD